jgi:hypothetical protein
MTLADQPPPPPTQPSPAEPASPSSAGARPRAAGIGLPVGPILLLLVLVAAAAAGVLFLVRPRMDFRNGLAGPVRLVVGEEPARLVPAGSAVKVAVPRGKTTVVQWELQRPLSADAKPMGETVRGSLVLRDPSGTTAIRALPRPDDTAYFAPLITNASTQPLRVTVNAGLQGAVDCGCAVRPGARRVFIGYYRLFQNSTVQARTMRTGVGTGSATFRGLGPQVTAPDGAVGLRFEDKDLR